MAAPIRDRELRKLDRAEGFLLLEMPDRALEILQSRPDWGRYGFESAFLTGEALRSLGRHAEALRPLERAASLRPGHLGVALSLGWCYKRTHRLAQAIDALQAAVRENPDQPLLHYNLACYWSLAGNTARAIEALEQALGLDSELRDRIAAEPDFDSIRHEPDFGRLVVGKAPQT